MRRHVHNSRNTLKCNRTNIILIRRRKRRAHVTFFVPAIMVWKVRSVKVFPKASGASSDSHLAKVFISTEPLQSMLCMCVVAGGWAYLTKAFWCKMIEGRLSLDFHKYATVHDLGWIGSQVLASRWCFHFAIGAIKN